MAFLLSRGVDAGLSDTYLDACQASVSAVAKIASLDPNGFIPHSFDLKGQVADSEYVWWSQAELLRGLAHFVVHRGRTDLDPVLNRSLASVRAHFIDPVHGGWYPKPDAQKGDKGGEWNAG
jgi:mannose/cellobiose epimerase-like protein (N-acyl-D-glucosamine 2-epimerase family)